MSTITVVYQKQQFVIDVGSFQTASLFDLKQILFEKTGILPGYMKLLFSGAVANMKDDKAKLFQFGLKDRCRVMLLGTPVALLSSPVNESAVDSSSQLKSPLQHPAIKSAIGPVKSLLNGVVDYKLVLVKLYPTQAAELHKIYNAHIQQEVLPTYCPEDDASTGKKRHRTDMDGMPAIVETEEGIDRFYRFLSEKLLRVILALDGIEIDGDADLRTDRKRHVVLIQTVLSTLDKMRNIVRK